jgi:hypothetical protein
MKRGDDYVGKLHARAAGRAGRLEPTPMAVRGLAGVTIDTAGGESLSLDRGDGGLQAVRAIARASLHAWTILGASRGEAGILGRGDPAGAAARPHLPPGAQRRQCVGAWMRQIVGDVPLGGSPFPPIADYAFLSDCETTALVAPSGNIEWMCLPRMDGPSVFGAMLDRDAGGFRLGPSDTSVPAGRRYLPGTMVLETTWGTRTAG